MIMNLYGPEPTDWLNNIRSVGVSYDGYRWTFGLAGAVQPFEDTDRYLLRKKRDRFTPEMLSQYLAALGISMFDPDFYLPEGTSATLIEKVGSFAPDSQEFSLEEAR